MGTACLFSLVKTVSSIYVTCLGTIGVSNGWRLDPVLMVPRSNASLYGLKTLLSLVATYRLN